VFPVEKASSLSEAEENLDESAGADTDNGDFAGGDMGGARASKSEIVSAKSRGEGSGMRPRALKPVDSAMFSGVANQITGDQLAESLQQALSAASRSEAGLGSLQRSVRDASRALTASRHAHESLSEELRVMYRGLNDVMSEKAAVERYAALLTQERDAALDAAEEARREAKRDREFLLREQDRFIQLLLEEHEAELQQLRRGLVVRQAPQGTRVTTNEGQASPRAPAIDSGAEALDSPGARLSAEPDPVQVRAPEERESVLPPAPQEEEHTASRPSGAALARLALAETGASERHKQSASSHVDITSLEKAIQQDAAIDRKVVDKALTDTQRSEAPSLEEGQKTEERAPTYPPPPAVLDLDSLAAEVDGNSERPPPIRRVGGVEPKVHLKPARVPSQLFDTLVSPTASSDPHRKS
jgi:hypothetical protein